MEVKDYPFQKSHLAIIAYIQQNGTLHRSDDIMQTDLHMPRTTMYEYLKDLECFNLVIKDHPEHPGKGRKQTVWRLNIPEYEKYQRQGLLVVRPLSKIKKFRAILRW